MCFYKLILKGGIIMIKLHNTIHELLESKRQNSVLKSMFVSKKVGYGADRTNVQIDIEAYDQTFLNAEQNKGQDYIIDHLLKQLNNEKLLNAIKKHLDIDYISGITYTYYSDVYPTYESIAINTDGQMKTLFELMSEYETSKTL